MRERLWRSASSAIREQLRSHLLGVLERVRWSMVVCRSIISDVVCLGTSGRPRTADLIGRAQLEEMCWLDVGAAHFAEHPNRGRSIRGADDHLGDRT